MGGGATTGAAGTPSGASAGGATGAVGGGAITSGVWDANGLRNHPKPAGAGAGVGAAGTTGPPTGAVVTTGAPAAVAAWACEGAIGGVAKGAATGAGAAGADAPAGRAGSDAVVGAGAGLFLKKLNIGRFLESLHSMKRAFTLLGLVACLSSGAAFAASPPVSPPPFAPTATASGAQQFTLKNGMQLIVQPDHRAPTAVHMVWLRVGSMDEVDGTSGVAHVLEHMMFKGSKTVPPGDFSRRVAALGGA